MLRRAGFGIVLTPALIALLTVFAPSGGAEPLAPLAPHVEGEVIVKFKAHVSGRQRESIRNKLGSVRSRRLDPIRAEHAVIREMTVAQALARYRGDPRIEYIEPNYILSTQALPDDPSFLLQWGLHNVGQTGGDAGADIMAAEAWDVITDARDVVVAVIDTGIDYNHPDLADNIFINTGEIPNNGIDDDDNGFIDDIRGWNFVTQNNDPLDDNGHGTHVSGIVGAVGDNGLGVAGVAWRVQLMGLKFLNSAGLGSTAGAVSAVQYATLMGVDVINASWGGGASSEALAEAIAAAGAADILFVASAGNGNPGTNIDLVPFFPAGLGLDNIVSVAATNDRDRLWTGSNFGINGVDLAAPGAAVYSTVPGGGYAFLSGTSMAAPHVSGALALFRSRFPGTTGAEAKDLLLERADRLETLQGLVGDARRLNAYLPIASPDETPPAKIETLSTFNAESSRIDLSWIATGDDGDEGTARRYELRYSTQDIDAGNFDQATLVEDLPDPRPAGSEEQWRVGGLQPSTTYFFAILVLDEFGNASPISNVATGVTLGPPAITSEPASFSADLFTGQSTTQTMTLVNSGLGEYVFSVEIERSAAAAEADELGLAFSYSEAELPPANPSAQSYGPDFEPAPEEAPALQPTGAADGLRVMILQSGADVSTIRAELIAIDDISFVDQLDVRLAAPTLADLGLFDAVIVVANNPVSDQIALGDLLADYADSGGGVIMTLATLISGWEVRGRFLDEGYYPVDIGSGPLAPSSLGEFDADHPIMQGVTEAEGDLLGDLSLAAGANLVAEWENGEPFVATKRGNVAAVNVYIAGNGFWTGDVPRILRNAVFWTSNTIDWLSTSQRSGTVPAGSSLEVEVTFDASGLGAGQYQADIVLTGNDPDDGVVRKLAELSVTGAPDLEITPAIIDFGPLFLGDSETRFVFISNTGTETANVGNIVSDNSEFSPAGNSLQLAPGQSAFLAVTFAPVDEGTSAANLTFFSDDPDEPELTVALLGTGLVPPQIVVAPGSFAVDLLTGQVATDTLTVTNDGGSRLDVDLAVQLGELESSAPASPPAEDPGVPDAVLSEPAGAAGPPGILMDLSHRAPADPYGRSSGELGALLGEPFVFSENFEDGLLDGWNEEQNTNIKEVVAGVGANGTEFSYHQINFSPGHFNGVARSFGERQPSYAGFYVRSSDTTENDGYFLLRAINGLEAIFFFARDSGVFYCNGDVGGNTSVPYQADTWYFIEFRDIDFAERQFDYYVNGALIQEDIPMRDTGTQESFWEVDLYNFDDNSEAWWDEILIADEAPTLPVEVGPQSLSLAPGETADVAVTFNAAGLAGGQILANIAVNSNDPDEPQVLVPATLTITSAADIEVSDSLVDWGSVFVGQSSGRVLEIGNTGFETLTITQISVDDPSFTADVTSVDLEPGETRELALTFTAAAAGAHDATLSIVSNDPDHGVLSVSLQALGLLPPVIEVTPTTFQQELFTGELQSRSMTLANNGNSDLLFEIRVDTPDPTAKAGLPGPGSEARRLRETPATGSGIDGPPFTFKDGFEDGNFDGWIDAGGPAIKAVTDETAADGTVYSYRETNAAGGHYTGIYQVLPSARPVYAGFYVRPGSETAPDAYFALRDANGADGIFFFAGPDGNFGINSNVGGNQSVPYTAHTWYRIEFRQIDWLTKTFDYYVNGLLIQEQIPFRNPLVVGSFSRLDLYSFQTGAEAWWDEISVSSVEPPRPVSVSPIGGVVPAGQSLAVSVNFNAKNLAGGDYPAEILIESNDPESPLVVAQANLTVVEAPDIELGQESLDFGSLFVGLTSQRTLRVFNDGSAPLSVTGVSVDDADFSFDAGGFTLDPGSLQDIAITFAPSRGGGIGGTLSLTSDDPDEPVRTVELTGEGRLPPVAEVSPASLQVDLFTGQLATKPLTLTNAGVGGLVWRVAFADSQPDWLAVEPAAGSLGGAESVVLTVDFAAGSLAGGNYASEMVVESNDPLEPRVPVSVLLHVTDAPDMSLSETDLAFGDVFLETSRTRQLIVSNDGTLDLIVSEITTDNPDFAVGTTGFSIQPGAAAEVQVTFTPPGLGSFSGTLTLVSNDPDAGALSVPLTANGAIPPSVTVTPTSVSAELLSGDLVTQTLSLGNTGGSALTFDIVVEERTPSPFPAFATSADGRAEASPLGTVFVPGELSARSAAETAGPPRPVMFDGRRAQAGPVFVADNFEDGDFEGWEIGTSEGLRSVTGATAADGTAFSYHEAQSTLGHLDGIYQVFGPAQPGHIGFWIRPGDEAADDTYFVVRDSAGREVIWFFARSTGRFYVNADSGGHQLVPYTEDTWYHIEFRNIDFQVQRFDYYINGERVKTNIPFRNFGEVADMSRVDLYNFSAGAEAWWDEIIIAAVQPFTAVSVRPDSGTVPVDGQLELDVRFDARGLNGGVYPGNIVIRTNDPQQSEVIVRTDLSVTGIPDIGASQTLLEFDTVRVGFPETRSVTITNFGTGILTVDSVVIPHSEFSPNQSSFELPPLQSKAITVTFLPESAGPKSSTMTVTSDDPNRPEVSVDLTGSGIVAPLLTVEPGSIHEDRLTGQMSTRTLALTNEGGELLEFSIALQDLSATSIPVDLVSFRDDIEGDTGGWTTISYAEDDLWHVTEFDASSPTHSWWCSQPEVGHYATPDEISNAVITPLIDLRGLQTPITLTFHENFQTEPGWDKCMVDVTTDGGASWTPLRGDYDSAPSGTTQGWVVENLDLSPFADQIVQVRFYFETLDANNNAFPGWRFDDVRVRSIGAPWLDLTPKTGSIAPFVTEELLVTFNALEARPVGLYEASIDITSNDPDHPLIQLPATMEVGAASRLVLPGDSVTTSSSLDLTGGRDTRHRFEVPVRPVLGGEVVLSAAGDYAGADKTATLTAEAFVLGSAGGSGVECARAVRAFPLSAAQLRVLAADDVIDMDVRNSPQVGECEVNSHALELTYRIPRERLDLGTVDAGASTATAMDIANSGAGELQIHAVVSNSPAIAVSPPSLSIAPLSSAEVTVTFAPTAAGMLAGEIRFVSNDPVHGTVALPVVGEARIPPAVAAIAPDVLVAALPPRSGRTRSKTVRLSNTGQAELSWSAAIPELGTVVPDAGTIGPGTFADITVTFASATLDPGDYASTLTIDSNSAGGRIELPLTLHVRETELQHIRVDFTPRFTDRTDTIEFSLELDPDYDPQDVMVSSVLLNDCMHAESDPPAYADLDGDGTLELIVQFLKEAFNECLPRNPPDGTHSVTLVGEVEDQAWFTGTAYLRGAVQVGN